MNNTSKTVKLVSSDNEIFEIETSIISLSETIKNVLEDTEDTESIPLPNVEGRILAKVIEYCRYHSLLKTIPQSEEDIERWDREFLNIDQPTLFHLILAANYLDIKSLLDLTCKRVADMIKGKKPEEIRKEFNIVNDFTPEEEEEVRRENAWCEDP
ncbi:hypothetical protein GpartN1_g4965.t1 [Galdieria partita]|uniref:SKP1-like protein n=1 Tax=Galdieria partita TaxID=83374 RepID=A0A9C7PU35_9RHOD|nr:hypothetical protein GpartN1_g2619.t1 [Galdieria partita]GJQ13174.1 hypothetical protein GpartN1_g4965.t1 [Galdieria partita]